ncbi:MAG: FixH family protein [Gallionellaceae bacterium]|nr:FixH family protein [Gallionellaceae bacterium]
MSEMTMNTMLDKKTPWWSEPMVWLLIALPLSAVIGGTLTVMIAYRNADTKVNEEYVKEGMGVRLVAERDLKAAELGIGATLHAEPGRLTLRLEGRHDAPPKNLMLTLTHATDSSLDMVLLLDAIGSGEYATAYAAIPAGKRQLELTPIDRSWRITGQWQAPFSGSMRLAAATQLSSPQHLSTQP